MLIEPHDLLPCREAGVEQKDWERCNDSSKTSSSASSSSRSTAGGGWSRATTADVEKAPTFHAGPPPGVVTRPEGVRRPPEGQGVLGFDAHILVGRRFSRVCDEDEDVDPTDCEIGGVHKKWLWNYRPQNNRGIAYKLSLHRRASNGPQCSKKSTGRLSWTTALADLMEICGRTSFFGCGLDLL